jgi:hypothetical protein
LYSPRVHYAASEAHHYRARTAQQFVGELYDAPEAPVWGENDDVQRAVPREAYLLFDDGTQPGDLATARSLFVIGGVIAGIALVAFLISLRMQQEEAEADPSP